MDTILLLFMVCWVLFHEPSCDCEARAGRQSDFFNKRDWDYIQSEKFTHEQIEKVIASRALEVCPSCFRDRYGRGKERSKVV